MSSRPPASRRRRAAAGAAATLAAVLFTTVLSAFALAQPAAADTRTFTDRGGHVTTVTVRHSHSRVTVDAKVGTVTVGSSYTFWLDTDRTDAGPEYKTTIYPNSDGIELRRVERFSGNGTAVRCDLRATADAYGSDHVVIRVPRSCLGYPAKVRASLRASYDVRGPNVIDWAPRKKAFFGWVAR